ncbi:uncharacterized protein LOC577784 [Strongylocentrotus purpuratus]|uniref:Transmembrane protein n=1 Tax=Strongylocentrotus purpuratus TaxID=7668 RepID=A0A7M7RFP8_STRPU|nr:uncharacterized protein LOC577784 [Strongylocentrotus purpuratus]XP_030849349.1 uncharacterized protein LOC115927490 [Strongylocentrotus purpuratus]XP_799401.1 uncharacterized protein LOC577784 [Strongylocentrotus purpuratus]|eukprot:XP_011679837.1 PREDICTED: uncharacterized protein LOC577784 [Strongylocentrotus purpuratus]
MGIRRQFIGFTGAVQVLLTLVMFAMGATLSDIAIVQGVVQGSADDSSIDSMAIGVPLWGGIVILMCGAGNIVEAFTARSSRKRKNDLLPCSIGAFLANLIAFVVSGIIIGIFSWSIYEVASTFIIAVSTVLLSASIIFLMSMLAMFVDCMTVCLSTGPSQPRPYIVDYDHGPPRGPVHVYKA